MRNKITKDIMEAISHETFMVQPSETDWKAKTVSYQHTPPITTSCAYLSLLTFSSPVTRLNYQPDVNNRTAEVSNYFGATKDADSIFKSLIEHNGSSFGGRDMCIFPYAITSEDVGVNLISASEGPIFYRTGHDASSVIDLQSARPRYQDVPLYPRNIGQEQFAATMWVLNKHKHFGGKIPLYTDSFAVKLLIECQVDLRSTDGLLQFVMEHDLPPILVSFSENNAKGKY